MSEINFNWSIEAHLIQNHVCKCCNEAYQIASGIIRDDDDNELALYVGSLTPAMAGKEALLFLMFKNNKSTQPADLFVSLRLRREQGNIVTTVFNDKKNPLGPAMPRKRALSAPYKALIFEIADFVVEEDPYIKPFLMEEAATDTTEVE